MNEAALRPLLIEAVVWQHFGNAMEFGIVGFVVLDAHGWAFLQAIGGSIKPDFSRNPAVKKEEKSSKTSKISIMGLFSRISNYFKKV